MKKFDVQIVGASKSGATLRAKSLTGGQMFNIGTQEASICLVHKQDGSTEQGLAIGGYYTIAGNVDVSDLDDGGKIYMLRPTVARESTPVIDWDALEADTSLPSNQREFTPIGQGAAAEEAPAF